jgi:MFS family permease
VSVSLVNFGLPAIGPELQEDFGLGLAGLGAILGAGLLGSGVALIASGAAVDRLGTRAAMLAGTVVGSAGLAAAALSSTKAPLFGALFVFGLGSAVVPVAGATALFRAYPASSRGWAIGVRQTAVPLGGTLASVTFPALYGLAGARATLLVSAAAVAVTGAGFALVCGDDRLPGPRAEAPLRSIWRAPGVRRLLAVAACYIVVLQALLSFVVPAVRDAGLSELTASIAYFAVTVAAIVARVAWGRIADRGGGSRRVRTLVDVGLVGACGAALFALALHDGAVLVVLAAALFGVGALGWNGLVYLSAGERTAPELAGRSVAVAATVVFVVSGLVTPLLGAAVDVLGWDAFWLATGALAALGALVAAGLPRAPRALREP